jgi:hypothetical protein
MLLGQRLLGLGLGALRHLRQTVFAFVFLVVAAFLIKREEAGEGDDRAGGAQGEGLIGGFKVDGGALKTRRFHLAGHSALPDQGVEPRLVGVETQIIGVRVKLVGRIASCASWAFLALEE